MVCYSSTTLNVTCATLAVQVYSFYLIQLFLTHPVHSSWYSQLSKSTQRSKPYCSYLFLVHLLWLMSGNIEVSGPNHLQTVNFCHPKIHVTTNNSHSLENHILGNLEDILALNETWLQPSVMPSFIFDIIPPPFSLLPIQITLETCSLPLTYSNNKVIWKSNCNRTKI